MWSRRVATAIRSLESLGFLISQRRALVATVPSRLSFILKFAIQSFARLRGFYFSLFLLKPVPTRVWNFGHVRHFCSYLSLGSFCLARSLTRFPSRFFALSTVIKCTQHCHICTVICYYYYYHWIMYCLFFSFVVIIRQSEIFLFLLSCVILWVDETFVTGTRSSAVREILPDRYPPSRALTLPIFVPIFIYSSPVSAVSRCNLL